MNSLRRKILITLDFDLTILTKNSDYVFLDLLNKKSFELLEEKRKVSKNWANHMQQVYIHLKADNVPLSKIKERVEKIPLNKGFLELFEFMKSKKERFDTLIISGANTMFLQWFLAKHNVVNLFPKYYSNIAIPDEEVLIRINPFHQHDCTNCDLSQCKKVLFKLYLSSNNIDINHYSNVLYAGDGENDYCLSTFLRENDMLFPRIGFPLHEKLFTKGEHKNLKCKIHPWNDGFKILEEVQKLL